MKDSELERLLKSAPAPQKSDEYWRDFPKRVTAKLHCTAASAGRPAATAAKYRVSWAWGLGLAAACIVCLFLIRFQPVRPTAAAPQPDPELAEARKCYDELEALFPNQLRAIVFNQHGPRMVLADKPAVPDSTPLYLKICGPAGCQHFVTFSGQEIPFAGEKCEVLTDAHGQVMLVGSRHVWAQGDQKDEVRIRAGPLEAAL